MNYLGKRRRDEKGKRKKKKKKRRTEGISFSFCQLSCPLQYKRLQFEVYQMTF